MKRKLKIIPEQTIIDFNEINESNFNQLTNQQQLKYLSWFKSKFLASITEFEDKQQLPIIDELPVDSESNEEEDYSQASKTKVLNDEFLTNFFYQDYLEQRKEYALAAYGRPKLLDKERWNKQLGRVKEIDKRLSSYEDYRMGF